MEPNDTLLTATQTSINAGDFREFIFSSEIGDNPDIGSTDDVDLYSLELTENTRVTFSINASEIGSSLDSFLRVFDAEGNELAANEDFISRDSFIGFQPQSAGTYYIGVSALSNTNYNPEEAGSGFNGDSTGDFDLVITTSKFDASEFGGGAQLLKDINTTESPYGNYPIGSYASNFTEFDGQLFFTAADGVNGNELWVSDGTADGTQLVKDINPDNSNYGDAPDGFTEFDDQLFFTADDGVNGNELWVSDGTTDGTQLVRDINPDNSNSGYYRYAPYSLTEFDGQLFFTANDGVNGRELWVSDGTADGTQLVKDINPDNSIYSYAPDNLIVAGDLLFFTANDSFDGSELWFSDGTTGGTQLFQDINPGSDGSNPSDFDLTVVGDQLFFTANDGTTGPEPWVVSIPDNVIFGDENNNVLSGTAGDDLISGLGGNDVIRGRRGNDILNGGSGDDVLFGDSGDDTMSGGADNDQIFGDGGNDSLQSGFGNDTVRGGAGNDTVTAHDFSGIDVFDGGAGNDVIRFDPVDGRNLTIFLGLGKVGDRNIGGQSFTNFEQIQTGRGNDRLFGNAQANQLDGGSGNDELIGGAGRDSLTGGVGGDTLLGGGGADILTGGLGNDVLIGNGGADTFQFAADLLDGVADTDAIERFQSQDSLDFSAYLEVGGSIETTRVSPRLLRIDLSGEDIVNVFGNANALDTAESQL